jgi:predicted nuclease with TOPRIM domain
MEAILRGQVQEGGQEKTCTEIVAKVLPKSSTFLRNVGLQQHVAASESVSLSPQMLDLQAQLEAEKEESLGLRQKLQRLEAQVEESEAKAQ